MRRYRPPPPPDPWAAWFARAEAAVEATRRRLPPDIRAAAEKVPCIFQDWPPEDDDQELLGLYGALELDSAAPTGPIHLFLGPIREYCEAEGVPFEDEVVTTWLHELGHHLGLDEDDLTLRGLG